MKIFYRKIKHFNWISCTVAVLILIAAIDMSHCCSRIPDGSVPDKSPADGRYIITISGSPQRYEPGQQYNISLQGIMAASSAHTFIGFYLAVESESGDPFNATDPLKAGTFELFDNVETEFSPRCRNLITNTNLTPKTKITVSWIAPRPGSGCVLFKATVIEHNKVWYMDDGTLTKQFCEEQTDDIENLPPVLSECCTCDEAKYELTFEGRWSRHTHPKDFPANQWETRFSDIIGASHSKEHLFWKYGDYASEGLREVAEHGSTRKLESELKENSEHIRTIIKARGIAYPNVTGKTFAVFRVDPEHHLISLVSQIYPSPDWIVGVSALELCLSNCTWVQHKVHNLYPWDAGTDGGTSYMSPDQPLLHQEPIRRITSRAPYKSPFYDPSGLPMEPLARLHITQRRLYEKTCENSNTKGDSPVECATHPWSKWSECSSKCGPGTRYRSRQFKNPAIATRFGKCNVELSQTQDCTGQCKQEQFLPTPTDTSTTPECDVTDWSKWSECSTSCGKGRMTRTRKFKTRKGHKLCKELNLQLEQTIECENNKGCAGEIEKEAGEQEEEIPAECQVFGWSNWSPCSCDERNVRTRVREVRLHSGYRGSRNPDPCEHIQTEEEVKCHSSDCEKTIPDYCYSTVEVDTCRDGETSGYWYYDYTVDSCAMFFIYACQNSDTIENKFNSKKECEKTCRPRAKHNRNKEELQSESLRFENYIDKVDCKLSDWTVHACNATCGEGYQIKTRKVLVTAKNGGKPCPKKLVRIERCFVRCADEYSESYKRRRPLSSSLIEEDGSADGASTIVQTTEEPCIYSEWSSWSPCTARCGENSIRQRTRTVINANMLHRCKDRMQTERCNVPPCLLARRQCTGPYCW